MPIMSCLLLRCLYCLCLIAVCYACTTQPHMQNSYCRAEFAGLIRLEEWKNKDEIVNLQSENRDWSSVDYVFRGMIISIRKKGNNSQLKRFAMVDLILRRPAKTCRDETFFTSAYFVLGHEEGGKIIVQRRQHIASPALVSGTKLYRQLDKIDHYGCQCDVKQVLQVSDKPACTVHSEWPSCEYRYGYCKRENNVCNYEYDTIC